MNEHRDQGSGIRDQGPIVGSHPLHPPVFVRPLLSPLDLSPERNSPEAPEQRDDASADDASGETSPVASAGSMLDELSRLLPLVRAQNEDLVRISDLLRETPPVSEQVLREANSPGSGARVPVHNVRHAAALLGARRVSQLALRRLSELDPQLARNEAIEQMRRNLAQADGERR